MPSIVQFNERVTVASLPVEEYRDAYYARRGPWGSAPNCDELWDGDRRVFWERELTSDELKEIIRFRRLVKYASMLQGVGVFGLKVPMPKVPPIIEELVRLGGGGSPKQSSQSSSTTTVADHYDQITNPHDGTNNSEYEHSHRSSVTLKRRSINSSVTSMDVIYTGVATDKFEYSNPIGHKPEIPSSPTSDGDQRKRFSNSQKAAIATVGKVLKLDSPHLGHPIHKKRSKKTRQQKRMAAHTILQPWFVILYVLTPLYLLANIYLIPALNTLYAAWKDDKVIRTAIEVPYFIERFVERTLPSIPLLQSTLTIGFFAIEMTTIFYVFIVVLSQLMIFFIVRPLILSLSSSFSERGAAQDSLATDFGERGVAHSN